MRWQKSPVPSDTLPLIWPNSLVQALVQYETTAKTKQYLRLVCGASFTMKDSFVERPGGGKRRGISLMDLGSGVNPFLVGRPSSNIVHRLSPAD